MKNNGNPSKIDRLTKDDLMGFDPPVAWWLSGPAAKTTIKTARIYAAGNRRNRYVHLTRKFTRGLIEATIVVPHHPNGRTLLIDAYCTNEELWDFACDIQHALDGTPGDLYDVFVYYRVLDRFAGNCR